MPHHHHASSDIPEHLLAYCERAADPGLWAEPLNFITNAFFILYAIYGYRYLKRTPNASFKQMGDVWMLIVAMILIGIGSGLWHSWAAPGWTVIVDTVPIYLFINIYIFSLFRRLAGFSWGRCVLIWFGFTALNTVIQQSLPMQTLNGSLMYVPTFFLMLASGAYLKLSGKAHGPAMMWLSGLFFVSLCFRTLDLPLCDMIPMGTHFAWHCLNAILLFKLVALLMHKRAMA